MNDRIAIKGHDGAFAAYIARPKNSPAPAVVVLQELFGVNADIRKHCDELAEQGFLAVAPDLFWRQEPGVDLNVTSKADWEHGLRLYGAYDRDSVEAELVHRRQKRPHRASRSGAFFRQAHGCNDL
jgi:carboxymethylenebutenolidase